ncbi:MAG: RNA-directed DNA polymerase [Paraclostridium sp.]
MCLENKEGDEWFYKGTTYPIPKKNPKNPSDYRLITCMSNLYKLVTKCVTRVLQIEVERRGLLSENQLGTVKQVQGAKEQVFLNKIINNHHANNLSTIWYDVKKAFDSIEQKYLIKCLERLNFPNWTTNFIKATISKWNLELRFKKNVLLEKKVNKGILQGDSLSPLLFVLCMDPLSRRLNEAHPKINIHCNEVTHASNHLLFIDDLKLIASDKENLKRMINEVETFFGKIGLEINKEKSATNETECSENAVLMEGCKGYKYLGIIENSRSQQSAESFKNIKEEMLARIERILKSKLNGKNTIRAINEHAISLLNYYVGVLELGPNDFKEMDKSIRQLLIRHGVHLQPGCKERLYLPRCEMGRGLHNIEFRSENMLLQLYRNLASFEKVCTRRAAILKVERNNVTHLSLIESYLKCKYNVVSIDQKTLINSQKTSLYSEINNKILHKKLYRARDNELVSIIDSSTWLKYGNIRPQDEARFCYLQDRNVFFGKYGSCMHCGSGKKTVDHIATCCKTMLGHDYTRRHNEVVRCLHFMYANRFGIRRSKRIRTHSVKEIVANKYCEIRVDTTIRTDIKIEHNRPDLFIWDKKKNEITLIEVGITNQDSLNQVENEKKRKYDLLAGELSLIHKCRVNIIPFVLTWDGIVTKYHKKYARELGTTKQIEAYIQSLVLRKTLETISFEERRSICEGMSRSDAIFAAVEKLCENKEVCDSQEA